MVVIAHSFYPLSKPVAALEEDATEEIRQGGAIGSGKVIRSQSTQEGLKASHRHREAG